VWLRSVLPAAWTDRPSGRSRNACDPPGELDIVQRSLDSVDEASR
jgi:hypothetical protein